MSAWRSQPRARLTYGASAEASRWDRAGTTSTRPFSAPTCWSSLTSGASSRAHDAAGVVWMMSSTDLKPIQPTKPRNASTVVNHLRERGTVNGSAAISVTPANNIGSREMFDPICELTSQTSTTPRLKTAAVSRTVFHSLGTRNRQSSPYSSGSITEPIVIGWVPETGTGHAETATTAVGASPRAQAPGRRFCRNSAAATRPTKRPATGDAMVASAASGAATRAFAQRLCRQRYGQQNTAATAPSANTVPRPKVTRPDTALQISARTPASAAHSGFRTDRLRMRTMVSRPADTVPAIIMVVRTPRTDIRYGDTTL